MSDIPSIPPQPPAQPPVEPVDGDFMAQVRAGRNKNKEGDQKPPEDPPPAAAAPEGEPEDAPTDIVDVTLEEGSEGTINPLDNVPQKKDKKTKTENFKEMRTTLKTLKEEKEQLKLDLDEATEKLQQSEDVGEIKTQLETANTRIQELEKYESLVGVKQSKAYKEKYVDGLDQLWDQALTIAKDYEVDSKLLEQAIQMGNRKELNGFLAENFDSVAVNDIRPIILDVQKLLKEKKKVDEDPGKAETELIKSAERKEQQEQQLATKRTQTRIQESWTDMVTLYSAPDSGIGILQEVTGKEDHNNQRTNILNRASGDFGTYVGKLINNGLRELPEDVAKALASRFQLAEVSGHLLAENQAQAEEIEALTKKLSKITGYTRPLAQGSNSSGNSTEKIEKVTGKAVASAIFQSVQEKMASQ